MTWQKSAIILYYTFLYVVSFGYVMYAQWVAARLSFVAALSPPHIAYIRTDLTLVHNNYSVVWSAVAGFGSYTCTRHEHLYSLMLFSTMGSFAQQEHQQHNARFHQNNTMTSIRWLPTRFYHNIRFITYWGWKRSARYTLIACPIPEAPVPSNLHILYRCTVGRRN